MKKILLVSFLLIHLTSISQNPTERSFQRNGDDVPACVKHTSDGGYVICGSSKDVTSGTYDVFVVKINASGNKEWAKTYGGNGNDRGNSIASTFDGGYIVTGSSNSYTWGDVNMYLIKIDASGNLTWAETFGNYGSDAGNDVIQLADSSYVITGSSRYMDGIKSIYMLKTDANGAGIFESHFAFEGEGNNIVHLDSGFAISGTININDSVSHSILIKADEYGNKIWTKTYGNNSSFTGKAVYSLSDGFLIGGGILDPVTNTRSSYILKTDLTGDMIWSKSYNTGEGISFSKYSENTYLICSAFKTDSTSQILVTKIDSTGNVISARNFSNESSLISSSVSSSVNSVIIVGLSGTPGNSDVYSVKTGQDLSTNCSNNQLVDQSSLTITQSQYAFPAVTYYSTENNYGLVPYAMPCNSVSAEFNFTNNTNCAISQMVSHLNISNVGTDHENDDVDAEEGEFVTKDFVAVSSVKMSVYPNPGDGSDLNLTFDKEIKGKVIIVIYDAIGRTVFSEILIMDNELAHQLTFNDKLQEGIYMMTVIAGAEKKNHTIIVK